LCNIEHRCIIMVDFDSMVTVCFYEMDSCRFVRVSVRAAQMMRIEYKVIVVVVVPLGCF